MKWLVFSYSLPTKMSTSSRVRIWRKVRKSGAVSPKSGVYILPYTDDCLETLRWLASEVEQEKGEALVMKVDQFENMSDEAVIDLFRKERVQDYEEIETFLLELEQMAQSQGNKKPAPPKKVAKGRVVEINREIRQLRKSIEEFTRVDFFPAYDKRKLLDRLYGVQQTLVTGNLILMMLFSMVSIDELFLRKLNDEGMFPAASEEVIKIKRIHDRYASGL